MLFSISVISSQRKLPKNQSLRILITDGANKRPCLKKKKKAPHICFTMHSSSPVDIVTLASSLPLMVDTTCVFEINSLCGLTKAYKSIIKRWLRRSKKSSSSSSSSRENNIKQQRQNQTQQQVEFYIPSLINLHGN